MATSCVAPALVPEHASDGHKNGNLYPIPRHVAQAAAPTKQSDASCPDPRSCGTDFRCEPKQIGVSGTCGHQGTAKKSRQQDYCKHPQPRSLHRAQPSRPPPCRARCSTSVSVAGPIWESLLSAASSSCTLAGASEAILGFLALGSETCRAGRFTVTGRALAFAGKLNLRATAVRSAWPPCFGMT